MQQQVIFVGGTSYSGSTLLDMMLSHDPLGFSCGEICAFIHPYRSKHLDPVCGCGDAECDIWRRVDPAPERVHASLFERFPDKRFHVDSSKSTIWIEEQTRFLRRQGIEARNVLIWKTPSEFLLSRRKRDLESGWADDWINYHRRYFSAVDRWVSVPYSALVDDVASLSRLCCRIGLDDSASRHEYWRQTHHTLFGNASAKIHLYDTSSDHYRTAANELTSTVQGAAESSAAAEQHRQIHRSGGTAQPLDVSADQQRSIGAIMQVLEATDFRQDHVDWDAVGGRTAALRVPKMLFALQRARRAAVSWYTRLTRG